MSQPGEHAGETPTESMSDEDLGRRVRGMMQSIAGYKEHDGDLKRIRMAAALLLVDAAASQAAETMTMSFGDVTLHGEDAGAWTVKISKGAEPSDKTSPHVLAGVLHPDKAAAAIDCFATLTYMSLGIDTDTPKN